MNLLKQLCLPDKCVNISLKMCPGLLKENRKACISWMYNTFQEQHYAKNVLHDHHSFAHGGNRGHNKTNSFIIRNFFWSKMEQKIKASTNSCRKCEE